MTECIDAKITHKFIFEQDVYLDSTLIFWQINGSFRLIENVHIAHFQPNMHFKVCPRQKCRAKATTGFSTHSMPHSHIIRSPQRCRWRATIEWKKMVTVNYVICQVEAFRALAPSFRSDQVISVENKVRTSCVVSMLTCVAIFTVFLLGILHMPEPTTESEPFEFAMQK